MLDCTGSPNSFILFMLKSLIKRRVTENEPRRSEEAKVRVLERFFVLGDSVIADLVTNHRLKYSRLLVKIVMKP